MPDEKTGEGPDRWPVCEATAEDEQEIRVLFHEVFGQDMTRDLWQWKYGGGRGHAVLAERAGRVVAHYGGVRRYVRHQGEEIPSIQCVDTMVKPNERGTLSRKGPYFRVARGFLDRFVDYNRPLSFRLRFSEQESDEASQRSRHHDPHQRAVRLYGRKITHTF